MADANTLNLIEILTVTLLGILIVFSVLIILMIVLNLMKIFSSSEKRPNAVTETEVVPVVPAQKAEDDDEIIAVLSAAIAASLQTSAYNFRIKSYKRVSGKNSGRA